MTRKHPQLSAARYFGHLDYTWWAVPQVLNFYHCRLPEYRDLRLVNQHPGLLYLMLHSWAKKQPKAVQQAGKHFWHSLSWKQRHAPLSRELGQRILRAFRVDDSNLARLHDDKEALNTEFYQEGDTVKSVKQGGFSYADNDGEGELEFWTVVECGACHHEFSIREQLGGDSAVTFIEANEADLEDKGWLHLSGPYGRCNECGEVNRAKVAPAEDLPDEGWANVNEDSSEDWEQYEDHLNELVNQAADHLKAHGLPKPDGLRLDVSNADWRGRDAWAECGLDGKALADRMRVNGQFTISNGRLLCHQDGNAELRCVLSHHDVPTGGGVCVNPYWEDELSYQGEDHLDIDAVRESLGELAPIAEALLCGSQPEFEYSAGSTFKVVSRDNLATAIEALTERFDLHNLEVIEGYSLAVGLLLERVAVDLRCKNKFNLASVQRTRQALDHWLEYSTEEECK